MTSFRGQALPAWDATNTIFIRSAEIELRTGSRFRLEMDRDYCAGGECELDPVVHNGNFTVSSGFITLNTEDGPLTGAIFPDYIRLNDGNPGSIWEKRE